MNRIIAVVVFFLSTSVEAQNSSEVVTDSLFVLGNYSKAITIYQQNENENLFKIATCFEALGNYKKALDYYTLVYSKEPTNTIASYQFSKLLIKNLKFKEAEKIILELAEQQPTNPNFNYQLGLLKEKQKDSTAILYYYKAYKIDSNYVNATYKIAKLNLEKRRFVKAKPFIEKGLNAASTSIRFLNLQALQFYYTEQYHKAISKFKKLIDLGKKEENIYQKLALSYTQVLDFEKAIVAYHILIKKYDSKNPTYHYNLGVCYNVLNYIEDAKSQFEIAIALKHTPLDKEFVTLGMLYKKQNENKKALILFKKALRENAANETASYQIAVITDYIENDKTKVIKYYQKYLKKHGESGNMRELAKARVSDLKKELHFKD